MARFIIVIATLFITGLFTQVAKSQGTEDNFGFDEEYTPPQPTVQEAEPQSNLSVGILGGLVVNFMNINCYKIPPNKPNSCEIGAYAEDGFRFQEENQVQKLSMRGLGPLFKGFVDWSVNDTLGVRVTSGYDGFNARDIKKDSARAFNARETTFECPESFSTVRQTSIQQGPRCYANYSNLTLDVLFRYKVRMYEDITPWVGIGASILAPFGADTNALEVDSVGLNTMAQIAGGIDINMTGSQFFIPISLHYNFTIAAIDESDVRPSAFGMATGFGYRF